MVVAIPTVEAFVATVNIASELASGRIMYGAEMRCNLRVSKASEQEGVSVTFYVWDFHSKSVKGVVTSLK
jgi:hypothetical protein